MSVPEPHSPTSPPGTEFSVSREEVKNLHVHQTPRVSEQHPRAPGPPGAVGGQGADEGALGSAAQRRGGGCELGSRAHPALGLGEKEARRTLELGKPPPRLSFLVPVKACASARKIKFYLQTRETVTRVPLYRLLSPALIYPLQECWVQAEKGTEMQMRFAYMIKVVRRPTSYLWRITS